MKSAVGLSLLSSALASTHNNINHVPQQAFFQNSCPSNSILHDGECLPSSFAIPSSTESISFQENGTLSLEESRALAAKADDFPWTFWPECYSSDTTPEPVCVFTDQNFANGRGIFIVSTSKLAHQMLKKPAFTDPTALSRINKFSNPPFIQHDFPGKGRGLVANKTINRGDQIFASTPLLITNPISYELSESERLRLAHRGVSTLPEHSQTGFWALLDHFKGDAVDDRINTNAFEIEVDNVSQYGVMPEIAMLNHDCRPNAAYFWDEETLSHYVHATETILPGQEITITYINNERSRDKRVKNLKTNWGFECSCSACSAHPFFVAESDTRIEQIADLATQLDDWTPASRATPEMAETLVSLYLQERLHASMGVAYKYAAETYSSFGERDMAVKYARLAVEYVVLDKGFRDRDVREMQSMARDPSMTWSWNKRVGNKARGGCGHVH